MAGKNQNLTKIRTDIIEGEIIVKFSMVAKIEQSRSSLRILCKTQQQKELMLRGGSVAGVEVQVTEPRGMRSRSVRTNTVKKVVSGVPIKYTDAELQAASVAISAARIKKRLQGAEVSTSSIILTSNS